MSALSLRADHSADNGRAQRTARGRSHDAKPAPSRDRDRDRARALRAAVKPLDEAAADVRRHDVTAQLLELIDWNAGPRTARATAGRRCREPPGPKDGAERSRRRPYRDFSYRCSPRAVSAAIVTWNTHHMNEIVERERGAGRALDDLDLARLSPTLHAHINLNGRYHIHPDRSPRHRAPDRDALTTYG